MNDIKSSPGEEKRTVPVLLYGRDLRLLEQLAAQLGTSWAGVIRYLIRNAEVKPEVKEPAAA